MLTILTFAMMALASVPVILNVQAQIQAISMEELVKLADRAERQVSNLVDLVYRNETALQKIENIGLLDELEANVSLYKEGVENLSAAHNALDAVDYESAVNYLIKALKVFREVYSSIHVILEAVGLQKGQLVDNQGLLEAVTRQLQRIERLSCCLQMRQRM